MAFNIAIDGPAGAGKSTIAKKLAADLGYVVCADLRLRADDDCVEVPQSFAQLIGLIELLNDLMALLTQLRHCGLVHTVSNKNTHFSNLL